MPDIAVVIRSVNGPYGLSWVIPTEVETYGICTAVFALYFAVIQAGGLRFNVMIRTQDCSISAIPNRQVKSDNYEAMAIGL